MPVRNKKLKPEFIVIANNIRSLFNVGAIFRTADAFGVSKVYLTGYTPTPGELKHKIKISKTALGAEEFVPWEYHASPIKLLKELKSKNKKIQIVALENNIKNKTIKLGSYKPKTSVCLVLGEEVEGVNNKLLKYCDKIVEIPMQGKKESLNVSVAFGVAGYVISQNLKSMVK